MGMRLNEAGVTHARSLVKKGKVTRDERGDWRSAAPTARSEDAFIKEHGMAQYGRWHLGVDDDKDPETKGRYSFPFGDFATLHRSGIVAAESRAAQNDHEEIARAAKDLLEAIDAKQSR